MKIIDKKTLWDVLGMVEKECKFLKSNKKIEYLNAPVSFDIETSSIGTGQEKMALMYLWKFDICGHIATGRYWSEFIELIDNIVDYYQLSYNRRIVIYVHNLSFEFQFMCRKFKWAKIFALDEREPIQAITEDGIEFRCSYFESGVSLSNLAKKIKSVDISKRMGDLDYDLVRHNETPITETEDGYANADVEIVRLYIKERIESEGSIFEIPLTKTGYIRRYTKKKTIGGKSKSYNYRRIIKSCSLTPKEYTLLKKAFAGGFTHANSEWVGKIVNDVDSFDFTSSYPAVMVSEKFPTGRGFMPKIDNIEDFNRCIEDYCCLFTVRFTKIESKNHWEHYISKSKCSNLVNPIVNNGRIATADSLVLTITDVDFKIISEYYNWEKIEIVDLFCYHRAYLPKEFIHVILEVYKTKTELKDVEGYEEEYAKYKELLNSLYGMCVTDICRDDITFNGIWGSSPNDLDKTISEYNNSFSRFLSYNWGVWVTAYARRNLFTAISELQWDYIYSDTDSVKLINLDRHLKYFEEYNRNVCKKIEECLRTRGITDIGYKPKNIKGEEKPLGVWDYEGKIQRFKTLGAKRYLIEKDGKLKLTVAGLSKAEGIKYLKEKYPGKEFEHFEDNLKIPPECTGKLTHTYIDIPRKQIVTDYLGNSKECCEESGIHLEKCPFSLGLSSEFVDFLLHRKEIIHG